MPRGADGARPRIGVFGGSFDPPHRGHVSAARDVADALGLERVLWIPARRSPHKPDRPPAPDAVRLEMVRRAADADPRFVVDARELDRPPPSYMVDTLRELRAELGPEPELVLILGHDQWGAFDAWHRPDEIRRLATLAVMDRGGEGVDEEPGVVRVPVGRVDVSSSAVRTRSASGAPIEDLVPEAVADIVAREGLYRA